MVVVSNTYRIAYFPIPKVACSSLKKAMHGLVKGTEYDDLRDGENVHAIFPTRPLKKSRLTSLKGYFKFAVIREPTQRILSAYSNKILTKDNLPDINKQFRTKLAERLVFLSKYNTTEFRQLPVRPDVDTFVRLLELYNAKYTLIYGHTRPTSYFLGHDLSQFDRIYTLAELPQLKQDISVIIGRPWHIPRSNVTTKDRKVSTDALSDAGFHQLMDYLADDYRLLADYFPKPQRLQIGT